MEQISAHIVADRDIEQLVRAVSSHYTGLSVKERTQTCLYVTNNRQKQAVTECIRINRTQLGEYTSRHYDYTTLKPVYLSKTSRQFAHQYKAEQWIRFNRASQSLDLKRGGYYQIQSIDKKHNVVILSNGSRQWRWCPSAFQGNAEIFTQEMLKIASGETLRLLRNHQGHGITKGEKLIVTQAKQHALICRNEAGKSIKLDMREYHNQHIDYGYATTVYDSTQKKVDRIISLQESFRLAHHQRSFIKQLGHASQQIFFYTDNVQEFHQGLIAKTGLTPSALERIFQTEHLGKVATLADMLEPTISKLKLQYLKPTTLTAREAVTMALTNLCEHHDTFTHKALIKEALSIALGQTEAKDIEQSIVALSKEGKLPKAASNLMGVTWVNQSDKDKQTRLSSAIQALTPVMPLLSPKAQQAYLDKNVLSEAHQDVFKGLLGSTSQLTLVQGYPGTGKTSLLVHLHAILKDHNIELCGLAPTHTAVKELTSRGINAQTLAHFLQYKPEVNSNQVYVLDESSMVSTDSFYQLTRHLFHHNSRLIAVGDIKQLAAISAGSPFKLLQSNGVATLTLSDIRRQTNPILREAIHLLIKNNVDGAFYKLNNCIINEPNKDKRIKLLTDTYLALTPDEKTKTLMITPANQDRIKVNALVRKGLITHGELGAEQLQCTILTSVRVSKSALSDITTYHEGLVVKVNTNIVGLGARAGEYLAVKRIDSTERIVTLVNTLHQEQHLKLSTTVPNITLFKSEARALAVGERIEWRHTDRQSGLLNHMAGQVKSLNENDLTIEFEGGNIKTLNKDNLEHQHWDYAYAITTHAAQGKTVDKVLFLAESYHAKLMTYENFLVAITRAKDHALVFTDDKEALQERISLGITKAPKQTSKANPIIDGFKDITKLQRHLTEHTEAIIENLLGKPIMANNVTYRYGSNKGSLIINLQGDKRGCWHDFQTGEGGHILQLIQKTYQCTFGESIKHAEKMLSFAPGELAIVHTQMKMNAQVHKTKSSNYELKIIGESCTIKSTLAETYLKKYRGIDLKYYPESFRFHPNVYSKENQASHPALIVIAKDRQGEPKACQAIYLDATTANKAQVKVAKQTFGPLSGSFVCIPGKSPTLVTEGPETGLSLATAFTDNHIVISLGKSNFKHLDKVILHKDVIMCLDNDNGVPTDDKFIHCAMVKLQDKHNVKYAYPTKVGFDYNDILKQKGADFVKNSIQAGHTLNKEPSGTVNLANNLRQDSSQKTQAIKSNERELI